MQELWLWVGIRSWDSHLKQEFIIIILFLQPWSSIHQDNEYMILLVSFSPLVSCRARKTGDRVIYRYKSNQSIKLTSSHDSSYFPFPPSLKSPCYYTYFKLLITIILNLTSLYSTSHTRPRPEPISQISSRSMQSESTEWYIYIYTYLNTNNYIHSSYIHPIPI
jgi:hypothetical protein